MSPGPYERRPRMRATLFDVYPEGVDPKNLPSAGAGYGPPPGMGFSSAAITAQTTRHARRIYLGGCPTMANEQELSSFFNDALVAVGGTTSEEAPVVNVYINLEKKFAFVEFRSVEECSNALALDGVMIQGEPVRIRRPNDYNPQIAQGLGPSTPNPKLNLQAIGLDPSTLARSATTNILQEDPNRIFIGGLPYYLEEPQVRELLEALGPIARFDLVRDKENGNSKGYGFVVYQDAAVTDIACQGLNGMQMGEKTLTVRRAEQGRTDLIGGQVSVPPPPAIAPANPPSEVVSFTNMGITEEELADDEEFENIMEDMNEECGKYGKIISVVIPRPSKSGESVTGIGKVFVRYESVEDATKARDALNGRRFGGNSVVADFIYIESFASQTF